MSLVIPTKLKELRIAESTLNLKVIYPQWYVPLIPNLNSSKINFKKVEKERGVLYVIHEV